MPVAEGGGNRGDSAAENVARAKARRDRILNEDSPMGKKKKGNPFSFLAKDYAEVGTKVAEAAKNVFLPF